MKKILICVFSILLIFTFTFASYQDDCGKLLVEMNLLSGYPDGTLKLENNITRAEFSVLIMKMLGYNNDNITITSKEKFKDLKSTHWAYKSVLKATELGYLSGYENNTFRPSNQLTYAECCSIMVNVLGYKKDMVGKWPNNVINMATELKINDSILDKAANDLMTRGEVAVMLVNSLNVNLKQ